MLPGRPPPPPPPVPPRAPRLTTVEELVAPINADFAALLASVHAKGAPHRFDEPVRERRERRDDHRFTEQELEDFLRSLDGQLFPSSFADDAGMRRIHRTFWEARTINFAVFLLRMVEETEARHKRRLDPVADKNELAGVERAIVRALFRADRARLRTFIGRKGVDVVDLTFALWTSHAEGWFALASGSSALNALDALLGGHREDGIERSCGARSAAKLLGGPETGKAAERRPAASGMKVYQAFKGPKKDE
jgi:hypothetical protein